MNSTVIERRYTPQELAGVRGKVNDLLRKAQKKGWNADITIEAGEPFLYTIDDEVRGKSTVYYVDAKITFTGHFGFDGDWALVAVADARATEEPLIFLLDDDFEIADVDLRNCDHCGRRAARKRAFFIRSAAGEVKQVGGSCAHEYLGVNLFSAIEMRDTFSWDPDNEDMVRARRVTDFDLDIVLDCVIRVYTAFGYVKTSAEHAIPSKTIVTAMLDGTFWNGVEYKDQRDALRNAPEPKITRDELRDWMLVQEGSFGHNLAVIARSSVVKKQVFGIVAYAPAGFDNWREKAGEAAKRREEEEARRAQAAPVPIGKVEVEGVVGTIRSIDSQYGRVWKMRVISDAGWAVWGTLPSAICEAEVGDRVRFTATVERSTDDQLFGFYKRPTNSEIVEVAVA